MYEDNNNMNDNDYIICDICGEKVLFNTTCDTTDFENVCETCINLNYTECRYCGKLIRTDDIQELEGDNLCESCFDANATRCSDCDDWFYTDSLTWIEAYSSYVCSTCYDDYGRCDSCGEDYLNNDLVHFHNNYFCNCCHDEEIDRGECENVPDGYIYYKLPNEHNPLYYGIELEVGIPKDSNINSRREITDKLPYCVFWKSDMSILNCNWIAWDIEIVSHPMTYKWLKKNRHQWNKILRLRKKGLRSYVTNSCGIHIHLTKSYFTEKHLYKFMKMIYCQPTFTSLISQRKKKELRRWGSIFEEEDKNNLRGKAKDKYFYKRYTAVNLSNEATIEVRIFRGTLDETAFWKNIEYIQALIEFTEKSEIKNLTLKEFLNYIKSNHRKFQHLYCWLQKKEKIK